MALLVADIKAMDVARFDDLHGGAPTWLSISGAGPLDRPMAIASLPGGNEVVVADTGNHRILLVDVSTGSVTAAYGTEGPGIDEFRGPAGVVVDVHGRFVIADTGNHRIVRIADLTGSHWEEFGAVGAPSPADPEAVGLFAEPRGLGLGADGSLLICDPGAGRVVRLEDLDPGLWSASDARRPLGGPVGVCEDEHGTVFLAELTAARVSRRDHDLTAPPQAASTEGALGGASAVTLDGGGLYACDAVHGRLLELDPGHGTDELTVRTDLHVKPLGVTRPVAICAAA